MNYDDRSNDSRKIISEHRIIEETTEVINMKKNRKIIYLLIVGVFSLLIVSLGLRIGFNMSYKNLYYSSNHYTGYLTDYSKNLNRLFTYFDGYDSTFETSDNLEEVYKDVFADDLQKIQMQYKNGKFLALNDYYRRLFVIISNSLNENADLLKEDRLDIENENEITNNTSINLTDGTNIDPKLLYSKVEMEGIQLHFDYVNITYTESGRAITPDNYKKTLDGYDMYSFFNEVGYAGLSDYLNYIIDDPAALDSIGDINDMRSNVLAELEYFLQEGSLTLGQNYYSIIEEESNNNYRTVKNYIEANPYFKYYIYDKNKNIAYGNIEGTYKVYNINENNVLDKYLKYNAAYHITLLDNILNSYFINSEYGLVNESGIRKNYIRTDTLKGGFLGNGLTGYIITPRKNLVSSQIYKNMYDDENIESNIYKDIFMRKNINLFSKIPLTLFIIFVALIFLTRSYLKNSFVYYYDKVILIPFGFRFMIFLVSAIISFYNFMEASFSYYSSFVNITLIFIFTFVSSFFLPILIFSLLIKEERMKIKIFTRAKEDMMVIRNLDSKKIKIFFVFAVVVLLSATFGMIIFLIFANLKYADSSFIRVVFLYLICAFIWMECYKLAISYCKLNFAIEKIYLGEEIDLLKNSYIGKSLNQLENIEKGFLKSVEKMIKSEKMKAELITNVSHDLKTPLTSIINYVELLDKEGLSSNNAPDYLKILEQKSQRLKLLIEDLFEVSKLSSGNVILETSKINIIDLLKQTIGELQSKLDSADVNLKFSYNNEDIILDLDGKKVWRVFENLINNIIKYSLAGTRAYVNIEEDVNKIVITFKNISRQELDFEAEELFERFKRGDSSRSTDGNGLGLSISQNIILLHGGEFDIIIDGDLFKVIIVLNK